MLQECTIDHARPFVGAFWSDVVPRSVACPGLSRQVLLHAGPPYDGLAPVPVVNAAIQAILFEALASDEADARAMLADGRVSLQPAQDHGVVTPLAMVVSASMLLISVRQHGVSWFAPIVEGMAPALRFGSADPECRQRLIATNAWIQSRIAPLVRRNPVAVDAIVRAAIALGDDCHARTSAANEALSSSLTGLDQESEAKLRASPAFVLTVLMAAAAAALGGQRSGVHAAGGNGIAFGVRRHGSATWRQHAAEAPRGPRFSGMEEAEPLPAIGDSAVLDLCGLGGQALSAAPLLAAEWAAWLPPEYLTRGPDIVGQTNGIVDPDRVLATGKSPIINLAILNSASGGLVGRGFYIPPCDVFSDHGLTNADLRAEGSGPTRCPAVLPPTLARRPNL